jgi:nucleotide-binding universal stress UspA family protein
MSSNGTLVVAGHYRPRSDLLAVGSHGRSAFTGMLLGSVSIHCVTSAACPVVVVRGN